jgi:hypothetical protein
MRRHSEALPWNACLAGRAASDALPRRQRGRLARISRTLHRLNFLHAQRFNRRHERTGHLFGDRFSAWVIREEQHLENTCNYVLGTPVRAGLCEFREDWPWSGPHAAASFASGAYSSGVRSAASFVFSSGAIGSTAACRT